MSDGLEARSYFIDRPPKLFPTHRHSPEFWAHLGRTVATFVFLEEILGKAIFALTATKQYATEEVESAYQAWLPKLEKALTDTLPNLADTYGKAVRENQDAKTQDVNDLVDEIKAVAKLRNVLCHGSWQPPDGEGFCRVLYVDKRLRSFETPVNIKYLQDIQTHAAELACRVIDSVTAMGLQFPGSSGPGRPIYTARTMD